MHTAWAATNDMGRFTGGMSRRHGTRQLRITRQLRTKAQPACCASGRHKAHCYNKLPSQQPFLHACSLHTVLATVTAQLKPRSMQ